MNFLTVHLSRIFVCFQTLLLPLNENSKETNSVKRDFSRVFGAKMSNSLKGLVQDVFFSVVFLLKKKISKFWISSIPSTPVMPDGFCHFQSTMRVISGPQERSEDVHRGFTYEKHDFSVQNPLISPCGSVGSQWGTQNRI